MSKINNQQVVEIIYLENDAATQAGIEWHVSRIQGHPSELAKSIKLKLSKKIEMAFQVEICHKTPNNFPKNRKIQQNLVERYFIGKLWEFEVSVLYIQFIHMKFIKIIDMNTITKNNYQLEQLNKQSQRKFWEQHLVLGPMG